MKEEPTDQTPRYEVISPPRTVSMGDEWFDIASVDHFWMKRRFEVMRNLCGSLLVEGLAVSEIGCGIGLVQAQFEDELGISVDGFDLNPQVLDRNVSQGRLCSYDVLERNESLREKYDMVLLLDVLEHIEEDSAFLDASAFLAKAEGHVLINVPCSPRLHSRYDEAAGHLRRYTPRTLLDLAASCDLDVVDWTYWGLPLVPVAILRKLLVHGANDEDVIRLGFQPPGDFVNWAMGQAARLELIPQKLFGTSLLALLQRPA